MLFVTESVGEGAVAPSLEAVLARQAASLIKFMEQKHGDSPMQAKMRLGLWDCAHSAVTFRGWLPE